ncbi:recombinase family protein [Microbacterium sp. NPDC077057]|uniref:recombinase family protein n=1 Tax=Microbacterium sp. NPDC077057 TaxID=3154763 RepID=UPI0034223278
MTTMIGYLRVSTEEQAASGLGLEAQRETIQRYADSHGWTIEWHVDEGKSAKNLDRPELQAALARLHANPKRRDVAGLVVAKLDRLSRSVPDFAGVLELARARRWSLVAIDLGVDTSTPTGELIANVMMSVAQWERRVIGERTSAAMQAAARQGKHMGRVAAPLPDATATRLLHLKRSGLSVAKIADALNAEGVTTALGSKWYASTVTTALKRLDPTQTTKETPAASAA